MRFISYRVNGEARFGAVKDGGIVDLTARAEGKHGGLKAAIRDGTLAELGEIADGADADLALDGVAYNLPIVRPDKIMCAGRNYRAYHEVVEEGKAPPYPSVFGRFVNSFAPHGEAILKPSEGEQLDYEGELAVVIGKRARNIPMDDAYSAIAGYTVMNEGTVRDWMSRGTQNTPAKNFYRSGSIGPWMVTADEIADPMALTILTRRNGAEVQNGGTDLMIFDIKYLISHISKFTWLEPGDIIATGSPGGSIIESEDKNWLKPGDVVEVEIPGIGVLSNTVEAE